MSAHKFSDKTAWFHGQVLNLYLGNRHLCRIRWLTIADGVTKVEIEEADRELVVVSDMPNDESSN